MSDILKKMVTALTRGLRRYDPVDTACLICSESYNKEIRILKNENAMLQNLCHSLSVRVHELEEFHVVCGSRSGVEGRDSLS